MSSRDSKEFQGGPLDPSRFWPFEQVCDDRLLRWCVTSSGWPGRGVPMEEHARWGGGWCRKSPPGRHVEALPQLIAEVMATAAWPSVIDAIRPPPPLPAWWAPCLVGSLTGRTLALLHDLALLGHPPTRRHSVRFSAGGSHFEGTLSRPVWSAAPHRN